MPVRAILAALVIALSIVFPARADDAGFRSAVDTTLKASVLPAHAHFAASAAAFDAAAGNLCADPGAPTAAQAETAFADLVQAFGGVEMIRFGPARDSYRFERLFFWPDRKGRALKQIQRILAAEDPSAAETESLRRKSVAVQGLGAIEYLLFGTGREALGEPGSFRCRYLVAASGAVRLTADALWAGWTGDAGHAALMRAAGPDNALYKTPAEALQALLQAAREQIEIVRDLKLAASLGDGPEAAKPKRAPLWRSNMTLNLVVANIDAVAGMMADGGFEQLLGAGHALLPKELAFELAQARRAIADIAADGRALAAVYADPDAHARLAYALLPLGGAQRILGERYPAALGLVLGFNSLDGD
jgi:predicted lipoprotein